jgi:hypothetical protein
MKRFLCTVVAIAALAGCASQSSTEAPGNAAPENATAGTGVLTERSIDGMTAKFSAPERAKDGYAGLLVELTGADGKPVEGATITAKSSMPEHNMDGPDLTSQPRGEGKYWMPGDDMMKGKWRIDLSLKDPQGKSHTDSAEVTLP